MDSTMQHDMTAGTCPSDQAQRVLVTGATGFVGRHLVARLCEEGRERIRLLVRQPEQAGLFNGLPAEIVVGDLADAGRVAAAAEGMDVIYHLGAAKEASWEAHMRGTIRGTAHVVQAVLRRPGTRLVHVSSIAVYGIPRRPHNPLTEETPYAQDDITPYARAKIAAEGIVCEAAAHQQLAATILRPGIVYGPGGSVFPSKIGYRVGGTFFIVGRGDVTVPLVHVSNLVMAILLAGRSARGQGRIYHVVDDHCPTQTGYIRQLNAAGSTRHAHVRIPRLIAAAVGWTARRLRRWHPVLAGIGGTLSPLHLRSCTTQLAFDTSRIKRELGWQSDGRIDEHLRRTCAAAVGHLVTSPS